MSAIQVVSGNPLRTRSSSPHAIEDLETLTLDIDHLQRKRDHMVDAFREMGYEVHRPEGAFYLVPKSLIEHASAMPASSVLEDARNA